MKGLFRVLKITVVAGKKGLALDQHLLILIHHDLDARQGFAHGLRLYLPIRLDLKNSSRLGKAIALFKIHPHCLKKTDHFRADGMPAGIGVTES